MKHALSSAIGAWIVCATLLSTAWAEDPYLVKDINTVTGTNPASNPNAFFGYNGYVYFYATKGVWGAELWRTDGTAAGTTLFKDINTGSGSSYPGNFTNINGTLFFKATDATYGEELWKSDGTDAGTVLVKDIWPGTHGSMLGNFFAYNNKLLFMAQPGEYQNGQELFISDGTTSGTYLLKDCNDRWVGSGISNFTLFNGKVYFIAQTPLADAYRLWMTNGTSGGTVYFASIPAYHVLTVANNKLFFKCYSAAAGWELWTSDGTEAGSSMVKDIYPGTNHGYTTASPTSPLINVNQTVFFAGDDGVHGRELWKSDGTAVGTVMVKDITPGSAATFGTSSTILMIALGDKLIFKANQAASGDELWVSDGTDAGTYMLKDIYAGSSSSNINYLTVHEGRVLFSATDAGGGAELWATDGTIEGTQRVVDIRSGSTSSSPTALVSTAAGLYFGADNGTTGREVWRSDGTAVGTQLVADINPAPNSATPTDLVDVNGTLFFTADNSAQGRELWTSTGTEGSTALVKDIYAGTGSSSPTSLTKVGDLLFFIANDGVNGAELWKSDGTDAGTVMVKNIDGGSGSSNPSYFAVANGLLYFVATTSTNGTELWKSDGTSNGTVLVKDIYPGSSGSQAAYLTELNGSICFRASSNDSAGAEPWISDGTAAGTVRLKDIFAGTSSSSPVNFVRSGAYVYFNAYESQYGNYLHRTDGTTAGTIKISSPSNYYADVDGTLYYTVNLYNTLCKTDGTVAGTAIVKEVYPYNDCQPAYLTSYNGLLVFRATDGPSNHGYELWRSDGTLSGTGILKDIIPGSGSSFPTSVIGGNRLLFSAYDPDYGVEMWQSDATEAGTYRLFDIAPGSAHSNPKNLCISGERLYFVADNGSQGEELWAWQLPPLESAPVITQHPESQGVCPGSTITLTVTAQANPAATYQWQKNSYDLADGGHYSGATTASLTISNFAAADAANFHCVVTNDLGSDTSDTAVLTLLESTWIHLQPERRVVCEGSSTWFSITAYGTAISYQWQRNTGGGFANINGATGTTYNTGVLSLADDYDQYRCVVTGTCGTVNSSAGELRINTQPPTISGTSPLTMIAVKDTTCPRAVNQLGVTAVDPENGPVTWSVKPGYGPAKGSISFPGGQQATTTLCFEPTAGLSGTDSFVLQITDGCGFWDEIAVDVDILLAPPPLVTTWTTTTDHASAGPMEVSLDPSKTSTHTGSDGPVVIPSGDGVTNLRLTFDQAVEPVSPPLDPSDVLITNASGQIYTATAISSTTGDTILDLTFSPALPNAQRYTISVTGLFQSPVTGLPIAGDSDCQIRAVSCDVNGDGAVNLIDVSMVKSYNRAVVGDAETAKCDVNGDGRINLIDAAMARQRAGTSAP